MHSSARRYVFSGARASLAALCLGSLLFVDMASAQTTPELDSARRLFTQAYAQEEAGDYSVALEKFRQVQQVKDTAVTRFRIASCLEKLKRYSEAYRAFLAAATLAQENAKDREVAIEARQRMTLLEKQIAFVSFTGWETGTTGSLDALALANSTDAQSVPIDSGHHEVRFSNATGRWSMSFDVAAGSRQSFAIPTNLAAAPASNPVEKPMVTPSTPTSRLALAPEDSAPKATNTLGIASTIAGGVLLSSSVVFFILRQSKISTISEQCPDYRCPISRSDEIEGYRSTATTWTALSIGTGIVGAGALGFGLWSLLRGGTTSEKHEVTSLEPWLSTQGGGLRGQF